jgi:hypothetical protein
MGKPHVLIFLLIGTLAQVALAQAEETTANEPNPEEEPAFALDSMLSQEAKNSQ